MTDIVDWVGAVGLSTCDRKLPCKFERVRN